MKKIKYRIILFFITICIIVSLVNFININKKYPTASQEIVGINTPIEYKGFQICVTDESLLDEKEAAKYLSETPIEMYKNFKWMLIYISVTNTDNQDNTISLQSFVLESGAWKNSVMPDVYSIMNKNVINKDNARLNLNIAAGETYTCILPYGMRSDLFTEKQWENIEYRNFLLTFSLYPKKKAVKVGM